MKRLLRPLFCFLFMILYTVTGTGESYTSKFSGYQVKKFLFSHDAANGNIYYCIKQVYSLLPRIDTVYSYKEGRITPVVRSWSPISSIYAYNDCLYYVTHDSYTWRGRLHVYSISARADLVLLDESYGCGQILGRRDNSLYVETDEMIMCINLKTNENNSIVKKERYVTTSTTNGITYCDGTDWMYIDWNDIYDSNGVTPQRIKEYQGRGYMIALSPDCYFLYDVSEKQVEITSMESTSIMDNVLSLCYHSGKVYFYSENGTNKTLTMIDSDDKTLTGNAYSINIPINSSIYVLNNALYYLDDKNNLKSISLADLPNE